MEYNQKCLKIFESLGDKSGIAASFINIGSICLNKNDTIKALNYFQKSLKISEDIGNKSGTTVALNDMGFIYEKKGDQSAALDYYEKSFSIKEAIKDKEGIALSLNNISRTLMNKGQTDEALKYAIRGMEISKELVFPVSICNLAYTLKTIYQKQNKYKEAFEMYKLEVKMRGQQIVICSVAIGLLLILIFAFFVFRSLRVTKEQKLIIEEKQRDILDSINYAKRIQTCLLLSDKLISKTLFV